MASVAAGYLPILLFLGVALLLSVAFVALPMLVAKAHRRVQALHRQAQ
jgi:NADH-quinone oxidoreductase subunit A